MAKTMYDTSFLSLHRWFRRIQSHKFGARKSMVAVGTERRKRQAQVSKYHKNGGGAYFFWLFWVSRMSVKRATCIGVDSHDEQTPW